MTKKLAVLTNFLKHQYDAHVLIDDGTDACHGLEYALSPLSTAAESQEPPRSFECAACKYLPYFFSELRAVVTTSTSVHPSVDRAEVIFLNVIFVLSITQKT